MADFLVEIITEELPPTLVEKLGKCFSEEIAQGLQALQFTFENVRFFATPRRLAVLISNLSSKQPNKTQERKGPAWSAAFQEGNPTQATLGFAKSCGVSADELIIIKTPQGEWVGFKQKIKGQRVEKVLPAIVQSALEALPIAKRMRWGNQSIEFIRPVHSVLMLYGKKVVPAYMLGLKTHRKTLGHRFMSRGWLAVPSPDEYESILEKAYVIADFNRRKEIIRSEAQKIIEKEGELLIEDSLLNEVTGLVEWPVAIRGHFEGSFLKVPKEVLISAMQDHQRYFPVADKNNHLLPDFVTIVNLESRNINQVIQGNERVLRARLADAAFFFEMDKKQKFEDRVLQLQNRVFQKDLGTLYDKSLRLQRLTAEIAALMDQKKEAAAVAGLLSKADLTTLLVNEFPELQGIAGYYYAKHDGFPEDIAISLKEQYLPRFSGDRIPATSLGAQLALADRLDTLVSIFGINQAPTGDKDPFGLRRLAIGVLRILIEKALPLDLSVLLEITLSGFTKPLKNKNVIQDVLFFILERLKPWYQDQHIPLDVFAAVAALNITSPYDFHLRIEAVANFKQSAEAAALAAANKRVSNILAKHSEPIRFSTINPDLFEHEAEKKLAKELLALKENVRQLSQSRHYADVLKKLAALREPIDTFFDTVLVMTEDKARRDNRLLLLTHLRELFLNVADIALLQS